MFSVPSPGLPKFLGAGRQGGQGAHFHGLASGVCFLVPFVRQLWWWLVSRALRLMWEGQAGVGEEKGAGQETPHAIPIRLAGSPAGDQ